MFPILCVVLNDTECVDPEIPYTETTSHVDCLTEDWRKTAELDSLASGVVVGFQRPAGSVSTPTIAKCDVLTALASCFAKLYIGSCQLNSSLPKTF
jgi:hypothetical protein